jgi:gluconolactonase
MYVVTDGYEDKETGQLVKIDPETWNKETILNNYYGQPFSGFNDLDIDSDGNFWLTDSKSAYVCRGQS